MVPGGDCVVLKGLGGRLSTFSGGYSEEETPLPIPNRAVKLLSADGTWPARARESRTPPVSSVDEPPERAARCRSPFVSAGGGAAASPAGRPAASPRSRLRSRGEGRARRAGCSSEPVGEQRLGRGPGRSRDHPPEGWPMAHDWRRPPAAIRLDPEVPTAHLLCYELSASRTGGRASSSGDVPCAHLGGDGASPPMERRRGRALKRIVAPAPVRVSRAGSGTGGPRTP